MGLSRITDLDFGSIPRPHRHGGLSSEIGRRRFLQGAAGVAGAVAGAGILAPAIGQAGVTSPEPNPIPGGTDVPGLGLFHLFFPGKGLEPSTITDFNGFVGIAEVGGTGIGTDTPEDPEVGLIFDVDLRFMHGKYIGKDGKKRVGTFGFV